MHSNRRPRRASVVEMLGPHFVVAAEIIHVDEVTRNFYAVRKRRTFGRKDVANVLDHGASLLTDVQFGDAERVYLDARKRVVLAPRTSARNEQKITGPFDVRKASARCGFRVKRGGGHSELGMLWKPVGRESTEVYWDT